MWFIVVYDGHGNSVELFFTDYGKAYEHKGKLQACGKTVIGPDVKCIGCGE